MLPKPRQRISNPFKGPLRRLLGTAALREFSQVSAGSYVSLLTSQLTVLVLVRTTSIDAAGQVFFAQAIAATIAVVLNVRFGDLVQFSFPRLQLHSPAKASLLFWRCVQLDVAIGFALVGVMWAMVIGGTIPNTTVLVPNYLALAVTSAGLGFVVATFQAGFAATGALAKMGRLVIVASVLGSAITILLTFYRGPVGYLVGSIVSTLIQGICFLPQMLRSIPFSRKVLDPGLLKSGWPVGSGGYLTKTSLTTSVTILADNAYLITLGLAGGPQLAATVKVALGPARLIGAIFSPLSVQAFPRLAKLSAAGDWSALKLLCLRITFGVAVSAGPVVIMATVLMPWALRVLYGDEYEAAAPLASLFVLSTSLATLTVWAKVLAPAIGRPGLRLAVVAVTSLVVVVGAVLIPLVMPEQFVTISLGVWAVLVALGTSAYWISFLFRGLPLQAGA